MESLGSSEVLIELAMDMGEIQRLLVANKELNSKEGGAQQCLTSSLVILWPYDMKLKNTSQVNRKETIPMHSCLQRPEKEEIES